MPAVPNRKPAVPNRTQKAIVLKPLIQCFKLAALHHRLSQSSTHKKQVPNSNPWSKSCRAAAVRSPFAAPSSAEMRNNNAAGGNAAPLPPIYTNMDQSPSGGLIKVPEGFFGADHPNTKMVMNLIYQGELIRLRKLLDCGIGSQSVFQIADRGCRGNNKSMFHRQAILYLSLIGLAVYCNRSNIVTTMVQECGSSLLRSQFATGVLSSDDFLTFPTEYIAILMESFNTLLPLVKSKFWNPYKTISLLYRRRYLQSRTPIIGYPDLLRCALLRSASYNLTGFIASIRREMAHVSLSRLFYQGSLMVQHFDINLVDGTGTRRVFEAVQGPRYVIPNLSSVSRRLLALAVYQDPMGRLLSQVLGALRECGHAGAYYTCSETRGSLLLWLQQLVVRKHGSTASPFRCMGQATEKLLTESGELQNNYLRYDALNCISLLLSLLSRHDPSSASNALGFDRRILDVASAVAMQAGLADSLLRYAWPDHLLALQSLINASGPEVNFNQFARLLQHLPNYASTLAAANPDMRGADRWRVSVRRSILKLDSNNEEYQMLNLLSGEISIQVATRSEDATNVPESKEQAADGYCELPAWRKKRAFDYGAFYRLFERRYSMWACCAGLEPDRRPKAIVFKEDEPFSAGYVGGSSDA